MENMHRIGLLLDFYSQLITEKQRSILDMHYNSDYSLGEIAEHLNISRQGVYDNVKRGKALLESYEEKLGLVKKYMANKERVENIFDIISSLDLSNLNTPDKEKVKLVKDGLKALLNDL